MQDYDHIISAIISGDIAALEEFQQMDDSFPDGYDDFVHRQWIINAIDIGTIDVVVWMLSKNVSLNIPSDDGFHVLHSALGRDKDNKIEILRKLIHSGADLNMRGGCGYTPIHYAASLDDIEALEILRDAGADLTKRTNVDDYATPLEEAINFEWSARVIDWLKKNTEQVAASDR